MDGAGLYAGLQSGEIDIVPPLLGTIDQEDYASVQALENVTSSYGAAYAVENVPMIDLFVNGPLGAVSNRLQGAVPSMYGCLNNIQTWTLAN